MNLTNENLQLQTNQSGEITSIKFKNQEILHDGKQWWSKKYPMIWPSVSFSRSFVVDHKNYPLPKHGFWKNLTWQSAYEDGGLTLFATHIADDIFPFSIDIQHKIILDQNTIKISTIFSNIDHREVSFRFGHHPAFVIDDQSILDVPYDGQKINFSGKLLKEKVLNKKLVNMNFGQEFDTITYKDVQFDHVSFQANGLKIELTFPDFDDLQIWRPKNAKFICIEPWQGWNDDEYEAPSNPQEKIGAINLEVGQTKTFSITVQVSSVLSDN